VVEVVLSEVEVLLVLLQQVALAVAVVLAQIFQVLLEHLGKVMLEVTHLRLVGLFPLAVEEARVLLAVMV
jgi:hypothetical protein